MNYVHKCRSFLIVLGSTLVLAACGGDDNDAEVRDLQSRVTDLEARLVLAEQNDVSMGDSLSAIEERIAALETGGTATQAEIDTINDLLNALEERIDALDVINASSYQVVLTNVTHNQPLAPAAVVLHYNDYRAWSIGSPASVALETLAESGNPSMLIEAATSAQDAMSSSGLLMPGQQAMVELNAVWRDDLQLTVASMPVNTNDAFSGTTGRMIASLEPGDSYSALLPIYDAGTEFNSETAETVPGPAAGGEGFNATRDDVADYVARHQGVVTADDGYAESALDSSHRFDQGALHVRVTRLAATE